MSKWGKISYLICGISLVVLLVTRYFLGSWIDLLWAPLALTLIGFVAAFVIDFKFYLELFAMRTTKHGMNMGTLVAGGLILTVIVNYAGVRFDQSFDVTAEGLNSLSDQSMKTLETLPGDVSLKVFYRGESDAGLKQQIKQAFQIYLDNSNKLKISFINSFVETELAKKYLKSVDAVTVLAEFKDQKVQIDPPYGEEQITSALIKVQRAEKKTIYFLSGHGERDIDASERDGLSELKSALLGSNFNVAKINLLKGETLPEDASGILAIVGPKSQLLDSELEQIKAYIKKGGAIYIAADPGERHLLANLTKPFGVEYQNNYVLNAQMRILGAGRTAVLAMQFDGDSSITRSFADTDQFAIFFLASEVRRAMDYSGELTFRDIVSTDPDSFSLNSLTGSAGKPEKSSKVLAVTMEGKLDGVDFRGAVFGDSDFMSNNILFQGVNRDLALNTFAFLADDAGLISIRPKQPKGTELTMTMNQQRMAVIAGIGAPLILFIVGAIVWFRRRGM